MAQSDLEQYAAQYSGVCQKMGESEHLAALRAYTHEHVHGAQMLSGPLVAQLLKWLVVAFKVARAFELGTYTGYATLAVAEALPENGLVVSCDRSPQALDIAKTFLTQAGCEAKVQLLCEEAMAALAQQARESLDLIFMDADKKQMLDYYTLAKTRLKPGGIMVVDDILWREQVLAVAGLDEEAQNDYPDARAVVCHCLNQKIAEDPEMSNVILPIRHGLQLVQKRA